MNIKNTSKKLFAVLVLPILFGISTVSVMAGTFGITLDSGTKENIKKIQTKEDAKLSLKEIGPSNVGGRIRGLLWDNTDPTYQTLYAGGVAGGLFVSINGGKNWQPVGGVVSSIPISCIIQNKAGDIFIGTGEGFLNPNNTSTINNGQVTGCLGKGMFRKLKNESEFILLSNTEPIALKPTDDWAYINRIAYNEKNDTLYAGTNRGIFYSADTGRTWTKVSSIGLIQDIKINENGTCFFAEKVGTSGIVLKKATNSNLSDASAVTYSSPVEVATRIEIALTPMDNSYVYIAVTGTDNTLKTVYYSKQEGVTRNWIRVSGEDMKRSPVSMQGDYSSAVAVYPSNKNRVIVGGTLVQIGVDAVLDEDGEFIWNENIASPQITTTSSAYLHENIHAFVFHPNPITSADSNCFYVASDGGISFSSQAVTDKNPSFEIRNYGLNLTQFNSVAVANDGSVIGGTQGNRVPFISRGIISINSDSIILSDNQRADIMNWISTGSTAAPLPYMVTSGGYVDASIFQRIAPSQRKEFFVNVSNSNYARVHGNYDDATDNQTWDIGAAFVRGRPGRPDLEFPSSFSVTPGALWETTNNTVIQDSVLFSLSTKTAIHGKDSVFYPKTETDSIIHAGDTVYVRASDYFDYPFPYVFTANHTFTKDTSFNVQCAVQSRYFIATRTIGADQSKATNKIFMTDQATNFAPDSLRWYKLCEFLPDQGTIVKIHSLTVSTDGNTLYIAANKSESDSGIVYRVNDLLKINPSYASSIAYPITFEPILRTPRPLSSISIDPNNANRLLVTCGYISQNGANVLYSSNALDANPSFSNALGSITLGDLTTEYPVYSSLIEMGSSGNAFIGTDHGIYMTNNLTTSNPSWELITGEDLELPIYMIKQQQKNLPDISLQYPTPSGTELYSWQGTYQPGAIYVATYGKGLYIDTTYTVERVPPVGIKTPAYLSERAGKLVIYPNPVKDFATIQYSIPARSNAKLQIFSITGALVYSSNLGVKAEGEHKEPINTQAFKIRKGIFVVQIIANDKIMTSKMIVN